MSSFEEDATPEERITYLRERGIEIELPEDRKAGSKASTAIDPNDIATVQVVLIPCNDKQPVVMQSVQISKRKVGDQLKETLRQHFTSAGTAVSLEAVKSAAATQFANESVNISKKTLDKMNELASVEAFPLSRASESNGHRAVNMYLDEAGQLKALDSNRRASAFANLCGYKDVPFVGDIFVGRVGPTGWGRSNVDFPLSDFDSSAAWLKNVEAENYGHGVKSNRVVMEGSSDSESNSHSKSAQQYKNFSWRQEDENIELTVPVPAAITGNIVTKNVKVDIKAGSVRVQILNTSTEPIVLESEQQQQESTGPGGTVTTAPGQLVQLVHIPDLFGRVVVDDSTWFVSGREIHVTLCRSGGGSSAGAWPKLAK